MRAILPGPDQSATSRSSPGRALRFIADQALEPFAVANEGIAKFLRGNRLNTQLQPCFIADF